MKRRKGFTLIELMIVIAIIAILAAVLIPNFMRAREASRLNACKSNLKNISTAVETYSNDNDGVYPHHTIATSISNLRDQYLQKDLICPSAGGQHRYYYWASDDGAQYGIYCPASATTPGTPIGNPGSGALRRHRKANNATGGPYLDSAKGIIPDTVNGGSGIWSTRAFQGQGQGQ